MMQERALKVPETSEELMEMIDFVTNARTIGMVSLNERIRVGTVVNRKTTSF